MKPAAKHIAALVTAFIASLLVFTSHAVAHEGDEHTVFDFQRFHFASILCHHEGELMFIAEQCDRDDVTLDKNGAVTMSGGLCGADSPCYATLTRNEIARLNQAIFSLDIPKLAKADLKCVKAKNIPRFYIQLERLGETYELQHQSPCNSTPEDLRLRHFEAAIMAIFETRRLVVTDPYIEDRHACQSIDVLENEAKHEADATLIAVRVDVNSQGQVESSSVLSSSGYSTLDHLALQSARLCHFHPLTSGGKPMASSFVLKYDLVDKILRLR